MAYDHLLLCEVWFEAERIDDDLFRIYEPHVGPLIQSNIWLVLGGERDLVIDSGNGLAPLRPFLQRIRPDPTSRWSPSPRTPTWITWGG